MSTWNKHYHWKTKDATPWSKEYFTKSLVGQSHQLASPYKGTVTIDKLSTFEGDVELGNRKGRLITIYDCQLVLDWSGTVDEGKGEGEDTKAQGTITFPEVSHEVQDEGTEYKYRVDMTSTSSVATQSMVEAVRSHLVPTLLPHFHRFRDELIASHAKDLGHLDTGASTAQTAEAGNSGSNGPSQTAASASSTGNAASASSKSASTSTLSTTQVEVEADLSIARDDLWDLLTNSARIPMWTRAPAQLSLNAGANFSLFNGNVTGSVLQVEAPSKLVQKWRAPQWPAQHFGTLTTTLTQGDSSTKLTLHLEGVPLEEQERSRTALERFYVAGLKGLGLGTGAIM